ncbi:MAG: formylglycine-generating enzyme family protein, partial [Verrucomicrobiae bacterium]|nr:formylglycine-generating enzyme family protein [Verrucomicrobiae bacterium]
CKTRAVFASWLCFLLAGAASVGAAEAGRSSSGHEWVLVGVSVVLLVQCVVLLSVLVRLNRLLKSVGQIGVRLSLARSTARAGDAGRRGARAEPGAEVAASYERTRLMPMVTLPPPAQKTFTNLLGMKFVWIEPGEFTMGNADTESPENERPAHKVRLTQGFWMAETPVTHAQYEQFDPDHRNRRPAWAGDDHPVNCVTWSEAVAFCLWLSERDGREYRLPTEAQWEYAARGTDGRIFPWGNSWDGSRCNSAEEEDGFAQTSPVEQFPQGASPFGVLDMVGNVWEWCNDWFESGYGDGSTRQDPTGPPSGTHRVCRGGSWLNHGYSCRTTMRARRAPDFSDNYIGFRVICVSGPNAANGRATEATAGAAKT